MSAAKTLLVLGASGLTGYKSMQLAKKRFHAFGTFNMRELSTPDNSLFKLDITKEDLLKKKFSEIKPEIVLNTTALHNVDYCESHPQEAFNINSKVVGLIARFCNNIGSRLIHISTDYVFDGEKGNYIETDFANPQSVYAKSKLDGEVQARKADSYSILRPSVVYGWTPLETQSSISSSGKPMNFALWALLKMKKNEELRIVKDQYTSPTLADVLAAVALRVAARESNDVYHVSGIACMSRYEFTRKIAAAMGYSAEIVQAIESKSMVQAAKRPMNSCLNCEKIQKELNYKLLTVDESLAVMRSQIEVESPSILGN